MKFSAHCGVKYGILWEQPIRSERVMIDQLIEHVQCFKFVRYMLTERIEKDYTI
jgi:hypothetical protein